MDARGEDGGGLSGPSRKILAQENGFMSSILNLFWSWVWSKVIAPSSCAINKQVEVRKICGLKNSKDKI